jgi:hypothetical protein
MAEERRPMRCTAPARLSGTRTMRDCSASACRIACRIHQTAYEMNLIPLVSSNFRAARISPMFPSLIRSESETPWFWYFFATATTKRRLERTSCSSASGAPSRMRRASRASSFRSISGYTLISRRYWSSDSDSEETRLAGLNVMGVLRGEADNAECGALRRTPDGYAASPKGKARGGRAASWEDTSVQPPGHALSMVKPPGRCQPLPETKGLTTGVFNVLADSARTFFRSV